MQLGDLAFSSQPWHLSCRRQAQPGVHSPWHCSPGPLNLGPPMPTGGCILAKVSDLQLWSSTCLESINSLVSLVWTEGVSPSFNSSRKGPWHPLLQAAEGRNVCTEGVWKRGTQQRHMPEAISFCGRCQMEDFIRLFKFLKTYGWCFVLLSLFQWIGSGVLNYCVWGCENKDLQNTD